jgi:hypothetical protein
MCGVFFIHISWNIFILREADINFTGVVWIVHLFCLGEIQQIREFVARILHLLHCALILALFLLNHGGF